MSNFLYVCLQDENKIAAFSMDAATGQLTRLAEVPAMGGPSVLAISPDRRVLYVGHRNEPSISSFRIDQSGGALAPLGTIAPPHAPTFLALDRTGAWMLSAYYQGGFVAVHRIAADGSVADEPVEWLATAIGAHAVQTDPTNRFAFVPHIARLNDNVLEPPRDNPGPNMIAQFRFDIGTGRLHPNSPFRIEPAERSGPRHLCFHPSQNLVFFSDEQGCGITSYRLDPAHGTLTAEQTISSLPQGHAMRNTCSQIHLTPSGRFLYVANRGHNSIAGFSVDASTGQMALVGHVPTEAVPGAFALDPLGQFLFAAGTVSGRLAAYRINQETGVLTPLATYDVGRRPAALLLTDTAFA
jgi:6-phosphogluconolactonase